MQLSLAHAFSAKRKEGGKKRKSSSARMRASTSSFFGKKRGKERKGKRVRSASLRYRKKGCPEGLEDFPVCKGEGEREIAPFELLTN